MAPTFRSTEQTPAETLSSTLSIAALVTIVAVTSLITQAHRDAAEAAPAPASQTVVATGTNPAVRHDPITVHTPEPEVITVVVPLDDKGEVQRQPIWEQAYITPDEEDRRLAEAIAGTNTYPEPEAAPAWQAGYAPCATEDAAGPCFWDASEQGNGQGQDFIVHFDGGVEYITPEGDTAAVYEPCATEDAEGPCIWDATTQGNGQGRSFYVHADQSVEYID